MPDSTQKYPFKFLNSYNKEDRNIFFGRKDEIEALYKMSLESKVVWLYGPSGTGKTSLVQCGLASKFPDYEWSDIKIVRGNHIIQSLEKALDQKIGNELSINEDIDRLFTEAGQDSIIQVDRKVSSLEKKIQRIYLKCFRPVYLIFDQFEELFILGTKDEYDQFVNALKILLNTEYPVKIIFVIREDYLGYLYDLEKSIPGLMKHKLRIAPVDLEKTKEILLQINNSGVSLVTLEKDHEVDVATEIFNMVKEKENSSTIQLPYLQVFLDKLYLNITRDITKKAEAVFTRESLKKIDNIDNVLRDFLEDQVNAIANNPDKPHPPITPSLIWSVLSPFVSLEKTKKPLSLEDDLHRRLKEVEPAIINSIVLALRDKLIIRFVPETELYELTHDALGERIAEKRNKHEVDLLEKSALISSLSKAYDKIHKVLEADDLRMIEPYLEELTAKKMIDDKGQNLIEESRKKIKTQEESKRQKDLNDAKIEAEKKYRYRRKRNIIVGVSIIIVVIITAIVLSFAQSRQAHRSSEQIRYWLIGNTLVKSDNPTLGYIAIQEGLSKYKNSDTLHKQLEELRRSGFVYLQGIYPDKSDIIDVNMDGDLLIINGSTSRSVWNTSKRTLVSSTGNEESYEEMKIETSKGFLTISETYGKLELMDEKGNIIAAIKDEDYFDVGTLAISNDWRFVLVNGSRLYDLHNQVKNQSPAPAVTIPEYMVEGLQIKDTFYHTAAVFLDSSEFAVGYENGKVLRFVYNPNRGKEKSKLLLLGTYTNSDVFDETSILLMKPDRKNRFLFVSTRNSFGMCDLSDRADDSRKQLPIIELKDGHEGMINSLAFSENDSLMLTGGNDNIAILWNIRTEDIKKIRTLRGPNTSEITFTRFFNNDRDIVTASGNSGRVYLWKNEWPAAGNKEQVYRFSPFDLQLWGLSVDTVFTSLTTTELYQYTLDYYLNMPVTNQFPNEESYTQTLQRSLANAERAYNHLLIRPDYRVIKEDANRILRSCRYLYLSPIGKDLFKATEQLVQWETYLGDTTQKAPPPQMITTVSNRFRSYAESQEPNYYNALRLLTFYQDSVWQPLVKKYGINRSLSNLKRNIDICWIKYHLYSGNSDKALKVASELAKVPSETSNNAIYLVAAYLATDQYTDADLLYKDMLQYTRPFNMKYAAMSLLTVLNKLKDKKIGVENINRFIKKYELDPFDD